MDSEMEAKSKSFCRFLPSAVDCQRARRISSIRWKFIGILQSAFHRAFDRWLGISWNDDDNSRRRQLVPFPGITTSRGRSDCKPPSSMFDELPTSFHVSGTRDSGEGISAWPTTRLLLALRATPRRLDTDPAVSRADFPPDSLESRRKVNDIFPSPVLSLLCLLCYFSCLLLLLSRCLSRKRAESAKDSAKAERLRNGV